MYNVPTKETSGQSLNPFSQRARGAWLGPLAIVFLLVFQTAAAAQQSPASAGDTEKDTEVVLARVNGQPIYKSQLAPKIGAHLEKFKKMGVTDPADRQFKPVWKKVLDEFIAGELLFQEGQKLTISDLEKKIEDKMAELEARNHPSLQGKTKAEMRETARRMVVINAYLTRNDLVSPQVPEAEVREFYEKNKYSYQAKERVHVRHILVAGPENASGEEMEESRLKIQKVRQMLVDGQPFEEVAGNFSDCPSAPAGGDLGYVQRGYMPQAFDEVAFSIEKGKLSEVVQTPHGFHVLEVLDRKPAGVLPYEDLGDFFRKYLQESYPQKKFDAHIEKLRQQARIDIYLE